MDGHIVVPMSMFVHAQSAELVFTYMGLRVL
jgi:hypothetical protein